MINLLGGDIMGLEMAIKWIGSSVSGLVVIAGIICIILSVVANAKTLGLGVFFVILGLLGALAMTYIIRHR